MEIEIDREEGRERERQMEIEIDREGGREIYRYRDRIIDSIRTTFERSSVFKPLSDIFKAKQISLYLSGSCSPRVKQIVAILLEARKS